jgi:hypothetical protein
MREYRGDFEVHVTVPAATELLLDRFRQWCQARLFKCVRIILARGVQVEQPMATWRRRATTLPRVVQEASEYAAEIHLLDLPVVRVKVEAAPHNEEIPVLDADASGHPPQNYFEHHIKLLRDATAPADVLLQVCERHGAHLSRNAFRQLTPGREERFVTLRSYGLGQVTSERDLTRLLAGVREIGETIVEVESEYCVYDSNLALDAGWLSPQG